MFLAQERHHRIINRHAEDHYNTQGMERGMAEELIVTHLHALQRPPPENGLEAPHPASRKMIAALCASLGDHLQNIQTSAVARSHALRFNRGDVALARVDGARTAGVIYFFFSEAVMGSRVCFCPWELNAAGSSHDFLRLNIKSELRFISLSDLIAPVVYRKSETFAWVHLPLQFRG